MSDEEQPTDIGNDEPVEEPEIPKEEQVTEEPADAPPAESGTPKSGTPRSSKSGVSKKSGKKKKKKEPKEEDKEETEHAKDIEATEETPAEEKPAEEQPTDEPPADEQPSEDQHADEQPADEHPTDEQPAEDQPVEENEEEETSEDKPLAEGLEQEAHPEDLGKDEAPTDPLEPTPHNVITPSTSAEDHSTVQTRSFKNDVELTKIEQGLANSLNNYIDAKSSFELYAQKNPVHYPTRIKNGTKSTLDSIISATRTALAQIERFRQYEPLQQVTTTQSVEINNNVKVQRQAPHRRGPVHALHFMPDKVDKKHLKLPTRIEHRLEKVFTFYAIQQRKPSYSAGAGAGGLFGTPNKTPAASSPHGGGATFDSISRSKKLINLPSLTRLLKDFDIYDWLIDKETLHLCFRAACDGSKNLLFSQFKDVLYLIARSYLINTNVPPNEFLLNVATELTVDGYEKKMKGFSTAFGGGKVPPAPQHPKLPERSRVYRPKLPPIQRNSPTVAPPHYPPQQEYPSYPSRDYHPGQQYSPPQQNYQYPPPVPQNYPPQYPPYSSDYHQHNSYNFADGDYSVDQHYPPYETKPQKQYLPPQAKSNMPPLVRPEQMDRLRILHRVQ